MTAVDVDALDAARAFHETYERLAPSFGYETRRESAVPWEDVPEQNRRLMVAVAGEVLASLLAEARKYRALREAVEKLIAFYDRHEYSSLNVDDLRAALAATDGTP